MNSLSGHIRQSIALIGTISIVLLTMVLYFFVYVPKKEAHVNERNFRILNRAAQNLSAKADEYTSKRIARNVIKGRFHQMLRDTVSLRSCPNQKEEKFACLAKLLERETRGIDIETLLVSEASTGSLVSWDSVVNEHGQWKISFEDYSPEDFSDKEIAVLNSSVIPAPTRTANETVAKTETRWVYSSSSIPVGEFIRPLLRTDIFENYLILEGDKNGHGTVIYSTNQLGVADSASSRIFKNQNKIATIELNGVTYLSFNYPLEFSGRTWLFAGLQKQEDYRGETRSLDRPLLYTLVLLLMLLLLALPMIKVIFISKNEKLNKVDIVFCGLSLLLGCCFCSFIIIKLDDDRLYDQNELDSLSDKIETNFELEIQQAYNTMLAADQFMVKFERDLVPPKDLAHCFCNLLSYSPCPPVSDLSPINIHWTDSRGMQLYKWTNNKLTDKIDVSDRGYFRNFDERKAWIYPFSDTTSEYVLESIFSWTELEKKAVVSRISDYKKVKVVGITKKLRSVIEPILPSGFKFCLADQQGEVWFHSDVRRNLNENIFEEIQVSAQMASMVYRSGKSGTCLYENKEHTIKVSAMKNFPLFLIVMKDLSMDQQSQAFTQEITFALLGLQFMMVLLTMGIIMLIHRQAIKRLSLDWLKPDISKSEMYVKIALVCLAIAVLFTGLVFIDAFDPLEEIFFLLTIPLCIMPLLFVHLNVPTYRNYYSMPLRRVLIVTSAALVVMDIFFWSVAGFPVASILFQGLILIAGRWFLRKEFVTRNTRRYRWIQNESNVLYFFTPALAFLLVIIAILPTIIFFQHSFNYGRIIHAMVTQFEFAKQFYNADGGRKEHLQDHYLIRMNESDTTGNHYRPLEDDVCFSQFSKFASAITAKQPLKFLRHDSERTEQFHAYIGNRKWTWRSNGQAIYFSPGRPDPYGQTKGFTSNVTRLTLTSFKVWAIGLSAFVYLLWLIYVLSSRVFLFKANSNLVDADEDLLQKKIGPIRILPARSPITSAVRQTEHPETQQESPAGSHNTVLNHLFLVGLPFSGKHIYLDQLVPQGQGTRYTIDVAAASTFDIGKIRDEAKNFQVIVVDHFEYDLENPRTNIKKLDLLENLFRIRGQKIVVLSTVHPIQLFEACPQMTSKYLTRWHAVLAHFYKIICPLLPAIKMKYEGLENATIQKVKNSHENFAEFIEAECNHGIYLHNLKITLYNLVAMDKGITIEELVIKIRSLAHNYYVSLWNCCTLEEQYLIYDLAEDGVVNGRNVEAITRLVYKGIFIRENSLSLMNASFREFILSYVNPNEALILREKVSKNGNWSKMRLSLFFLLAIVAFFLLYSQKGLSNQIMGFITALAAALPLLFRVLEAISSSAAKKSS